MYFNFEDNHPDITPIGRAISWREGILLSIIFHLLAIIAVVLMPEFPGSEAAAQRAAEAAERVRQQEADQQPRFVFVQPRLDPPAPKPPPPSADASDKDRVAQAPERAKDPTNSMPFSRGNTPERVDVPQIAARETPRVDPRAEPGPAEGQPPAPEQPRGENGEAGSGERAQTAFSLPGRPQPAASPGEGTGRPGAPGIFAGAVQNPERYAGQRFENQGGGGGAFGPAIQFDTKGVEFGPWVRRFIAQIKRNWTVPYAAMAFKGHVVVTFNVHKNGAITDLLVVGPSEVQAFNHSSFGALAASNPTYPLPPEYPSDRAFFTVTFYYNEVPPDR